MARVKAGAAKGGVSARLKSGKKQPVTKPAGLTMAELFEKMRVDLKGDLSKMVSSLRSDIKRLGKRVSALERRELSEQSESELWEIRADKAYEPFSREPAQSSPGHLLSGGGLSGPPSSMYYDID